MAGHGMQVAVISIDCGAEDAHIDLLSRLAQGIQARKQSCQRNRQQPNQWD